MNYKKKYIKYKLKYLNLFDNETNHNNIDLPNFNFYGGSSINPKLEISISTQTDKSTQDNPLNQDMPKTQDVNPNPNQTQNQDVNPNQTQDVNPNPNQTQNQDVNPNQTQDVNPNQTQNQDVNPNQTQNQDVNPNPIQNQDNLNISNINTSSTDIVSSSNDGPEDPRIFTFDGIKYLLYNRLNDKKHRHMYYRKISQEKKIAQYDKPENEDTEICFNISKKFEKNWGPFEYNKKLYFLYSLSPLKIINYDGDHSTCNFIYDKSVEVFNFLEKLYSGLHLHIRNSSPLKKFITEDNKTYYLGVGHSVLDFGDDKQSLLKYFMRKQNYHPFNPSDLKYFTKDFGKIYYTFFYVMECISDTEYKIKSITPMFQFENDYDHTIEFACDLSIVDNDIVYIGYGVDDNRAVLQKMYLKEILTLMIDVDVINKKNYDIDAYFLPKLNTFLCNKITMYNLDMTKIIQKYIPNQIIFNLGVEHDYGDEFLICARCYDGNIRSWNGTNSIVLLRIKLSSENFILNKDPEILSCWEINNNLQINNKMISM
jgi:hypothetical protein